VGRTSASSVESLSLRSLVPPYADRRRARSYSAMGYWLGALKERNPAAQVGALRAGLGSRLANGIQSRNAARQMSPCVPDRSNERTKMWSSHAAFCADYRLRRGSIISATLLAFRAFSQAASGPKSPLQSHLSRRSQLPLRRPIGQLKRDASPYLCPRRFPVRGVSSPGFSIEVAM